MATGPIEMAISKTFPGSHSTTVAVVFHRRNPFLLVPEKMAPGAGPVAPLTHLPPTFSGENSPMRGRSETSSHTVLAGAAMSRVSATGYVMGLHDSWPEQHVIWPEQPDSWPDRCPALTHGAADANFMGARRRQVPPSRSGSLWPSPPEERSLRVS